MQRIFTWQSEHIENRGDYMKTTNWRRTDLIDEIINFLFEECSEKLNSLIDFLKERMKWYIETFKTQVKESGIKGLLWDVPREV